MLCDEIHDARKQSQFIERGGGVRTASAARTRTLLLHHEGDL